MLTYVLIFFAKLLEVSVSTVRVVLTAKGHRLIAPLLALVEITLWIVVASNVLLGITEDPMRAVAYGLAFALGIYLGIILEDKLALGLAQIEIIAENDEARLITEKYRGSGYGVTTFNCEGFEGGKTSIVLKVHRKDVPLTLAVLKGFTHMFVTVTDIRKVSIGSISRRSIAK